VNAITTVLGTGLARPRIVADLHDGDLHHIIAIIDPVACEFTCGNRNAMSRIALVRNGGRDLRRDDEAR
jgi:hypothetical protein